MLKKVLTQEKTAFYQSVLGHGVTTDTAAIYNYFTQTYLNGSFDHEKIIELGSGSGILILLLASKFKLLKAYGIEIQDSLVKLALTNSQKRNHFIKFISGDIKKIHEYFLPSEFRFIVTNPPYYRINQGKISPVKERAIARHEIACDMNDVFNAIKYLMESSGTAILVYPCFRIQEIFYYIKHYSLRIEETLTFKQAFNSSIEYEIIKNEDFEHFSKKNRSSKVLLKVSHDKAC